MRLLAWATGAFITTWKMAFECDSSAELLSEIVLILTTSGLILVSSNRTAFTNNYFETESIFPTFVSDVLAKYNIHVA